MAAKVIAYITDWCPDCMRSRRVLQKARVEFEEIDIERVIGAEQEMMGLNGGSGKVPTILIGEKVLIEPSDRDLEAALQDWNAGE